MLYRFYKHLLLFLVFFFFTINCLAADKLESSPVKSHELDLASSPEIKPDPPSNTANSNSKASNQISSNINDSVLAARSLLAQAQKAKLNKNYILAHRHLNKAEALLPLFNDNTLTVDILTTLSTVQRYLKNTDASMDYIQSALAIAIESREVHLIFKCLQIKGSLLQKIRRYDDSLTTYLSAQRYVNSVPYSEQVDLYLDIANAYNKVNEHFSGIRYYKKALKVLTEHEDVKAMPNILIELANTHAKVGEFSQALESAKRALALAREYQEEASVIKSLVVLSIIYRKLSSYEDSLTFGLEALAKYQKNDDLNGVAAASNAIGLIYTHLNQVENAKSYFTDVINLPEDKIKKKYRAAALRSLGKLMFVANNDHQGLDLSNEAFALYEKIGDRNGVATVQKNIGYIYSQMGNVNESILAYNTAIAIFQSLNDVLNEAETKAYLSMVLVELDIDQSIALAQNSLALASKIGTKSVAEKAYNTLILAEEKRENYRQALAYAKQKEALLNEIKTDAINKRLAEMHIILELEKKEKAFETLKREKAFMSLELDNQTSRLNLLEKEKIITALETQNTFIIISVVVAIAMIVLFSVKRMELKMKFGFMLLLALLAVLLVYSVNAYSTDIIKLTQNDSPLDVRSKYTLSVLHKALELSSETYGAFEIHIIKESISNEEKILLLHEGSQINLAMAMASPDWEYLALAIRIPLRRGVGSYRLLIINKNNLNKYSKITTLDELKKLTMGVRKGWIVNELLADEGFILVEGLSYDSIFKMLNKQRFDFILRGVHEVFEEISLRKNALENLMIEPRLALYIPHPYYIFVSPKYPRIAERIEFGLEKMIAQGVLQKMFAEHHNDFINQANLQNRTIINIKNKYLSQKTPINRQELWLKFDFEKETEKAQ